MTLAPRLKGMAVAKGAGSDAPYMRDGNPKTSGPGFGFMMHEDRIDQPLRWKRPRRIFTNSMSDLFHEEVTTEFLDKVWDTMEQADWHVFQVLTKRPERMRDYIRRRYDCDHGGTGSLSCRNCEPPKHIWLGTSVENARWRSRIDALRETPAAVRFLSCEPLLGTLTMENTRVPGRPWGEWLGTGLDLSGIDWVIIGGESGSGARPMDPEWVRGIIAECRSQGVAPFVKQMGRQWAIDNLGNAGHAGDINQFPADLQIREWPDA